MTPIDVLNSLKGKDVLLQLRNGKEVSGKLVSIDLNSNVGIEVEGKLVFFQGESVSTVATKR